MNWAVVRLNLRAYRLIGTAACALLFGFVIFFMMAVHSLDLVRQTELLNIPWIRRLLTALMGADMGSVLSPTGLASFAFTHPLTWAASLALMIAVASGALAGEVDRGTMDLLATLPVSRAALFNSIAISGLMWTVPLCVAVWCGVWVGGRITGDDVDVAVLAVVGVHLFVALVFLTSFALAISAAGSRREGAVAVAFGFIFYSFVLNVLASFWAPIRHVAFTGFLHYYQPLPIVIERAWQWRDLSILATGTLLCWLAGLALFCRRDIPAR